ncbi:hypothetical protein GN244_ATG19430 [Phytophthora infestans]|uniref:Uncharacterized protein n=1 Tax=Phytophthora infestans TaxID=4787 RepID=A0A833W439_PHYIN|nr:hypothetical protein GN244_ATG19430 [Phytophthora infestans]
MAKRDSNNVFDCDGALRRSIRTHLSRGVVPRVAPELTADAERLDYEYDYAYDYEGYPEWMMVSVDCIILLAVRIAVSLSFDFSL